MRPSIWMSDSSVLWGVFLLAIKVIQLLQYGQIGAAHAVGHLDGGLFVVDVGCHIAGAEQHKPLCAVLAGKGGKLGIEVLHNVAPYRKFLS